MNKGTPVPLVSETLKAEIEKLRRETAAGRGAGAAERARTAALGATALLEKGAQRGDADALIEAGREQLARRREHTLAHLRENGAKRRAKRREKRTGTGPPTPQKAEGRRAAGADREGRNDYVSAVDLRAKGPTGGLLRPLRGRPS